MSSYSKRFMDVTGSLAGLVLTAPVMGLVAAAVRITSGSPVIFRQERPGYRGQTFTLYKFRTMTAPAAGESAGDGARLTRLGRFLRDTSLDELPELINVLKGDMSLVGPRPLLLEYLPLYSPEQFRRHDVKPGVTGWAQVNGRNAIGWDERFERDVWYVENRSMALDLKILALTVAKVIRRDDIRHEGEPTMARFQGNIRA